MIRPIVNGAQGSAEILCGVPHIERLALEYYGRSVQAHDVIAATRTQEDPIAVNILPKIGGYLGHTLTILSPMFMLDTIAL